MTYRDDQEHDEAECFGECSICIERGVQDGCEECGKRECVCPEDGPNQDGEVDNG
jgi:hypothetical protein